MNTYQVTLSQHTNPNLVEEIVLYISFEITLYNGKSKDDISTYVYKNYPHDYSIVIKELDVIEL